MVRNRVQCLTFASPMSRVQIGFALVWSVKTPHTSPAHARSAVCPDGSRALMSGVGEAQSAPSRSKSPTIPTRMRGSPAVRTPDVTVDKRATNSARAAPMASRTIVSSHCLGIASDRTAVPEMGVWQSPKHASGAKSRLTSAVRPCCQFASTEGRVVRHHPYPTYCHTPLEIRQTVQ
jgi:hypothetical protein